MHLRLSHRADSMRTEGSSTKQATAATSPEVRLKGLAVSPGVRIGTLHLRDGGSVPVPEYLISASQVPREINRFISAVNAAEKQLAKLRDKAASVHGASAGGLFFLREAPSQLLRSSQRPEGGDRRG